MLDSWWSSQGLYRSFQVFTCGVSVCWEWRTTSFFTSGLHKSDLLNITNDSRIYIQSGFQPSWGQLILREENEEPCRCQFESPQGSSCWISPVPPLDQSSRAGFGQNRVRGKIKAEIREKILQHTSQYQGSDAFYTNGMKSENGVGSATVINAKVQLAAFSLAA